MLSPLCVFFRIFMRKRALPVICAAFVLHRVSHQVLEHRGLFRKLSFADEFCKNYGGIIVPGWLMAKELHGKGVVGTDNGVNCLSATDVCTCIVAPGFRQA